MEYKGAGLLKPHLKLQEPSRELEMDRARGWTTGRDGCGQPQGRESEQRPGGLAGGTGALVEEVKEGLCGRA